MKFQFSIRTALKNAWHIYKKHFAFFLVLSLVMLVLNVSAQGEGSFLINIVAIAASIVWGYVWISGTLAAVDGRDELVHVRAIGAHFPTFRQAFTFICVGLLSGFFILLGTILLIIPGLYCLVRLAFTNFAYVDRKDGARKTVRYSWDLVKGDVFWTVALTIMAMIGLVLVGLLFFGIGFLVTYPLSMLLLGQLYRALVKHRSGEVIVQPVEIPSTTQ